MKWIVVEENGLFVVFPNNDIKPHGKKINDKEYDLLTLSCSCNPDVEFDGNHFTVSHNAFDGREWEELSYPQSNT